MVQQGAQDLGFKGKKSVVTIDQGVQVTVDQDVLGTVHRTTQT